MTNLHSRLSLKLLLMSALTCYLFSTTSHAASNVTIDTKIPGGNGIIISNEGDQVKIAPDLRGGSPWFYWHFQVKANKAGSVTFSFDKAPMLSTQGPAISLDNGESWQWLGAKFCNYGARGKTDSFTYQFKKGQSVRFAVSIPYLQKHLDELIKDIKTNPHISISELVKTPKGRPVELFTIGSGPIPVLIAGRNHACETMTSYALEGFVREALSESTLAKQFRKTHTLYAVPIVDKDGVEDGDQGKKRSPHDHNRDYGDNPIYPEVKAVKALSEKHKIKHVLDFHCPVIRGERYEVFAFYGRKKPHNYVNTKELIGWIDEEAPPKVGTTRNWPSMPKPIPPTKKIGLATSHVHKPDNIISNTIEVPFAQGSSGLDQATTMEYGRAMFKAFTRAKFVTQDNIDEKPKHSSADFLAYRKAFDKVYRKNKDEALKLINQYLTKENLSPYYMEANLLMGRLHYNYRKYDEAKPYLTTVAYSNESTSYQKSNALRILVLAETKLKSADVASVSKAIENHDTYPFHRKSMTYSVYSAVTDFYIAKNEQELALEYAKKSVKVAHKHFRGRALNVQAILVEKSGNKENAIKLRKESVKHITKELDPVPVGVMGATMAYDLVESLKGIPGTSKAEIQKAADICRNHKVCPKWLREKLDKLLAN